MRRELQRRLEKLEPVGAGLTLNEAIFLPDDHPRRSLPLSSEAAAWLDSLPMPD